MRRLGRFTPSHADENREVAAHLRLPRGLEVAAWGYSKNTNLQNLDLAYATDRERGPRSARLQPISTTSTPTCIVFLVVVPLVYYRLIEWATGRKILDLDDDRIITAWVNTFLLVFTLLAGDDA